MPASGRWSLRAYRSLTHCFRIRAIYFIYASACPKTAYTFRADALALEDHKAGLDAPVFLALCFAQWISAIHQDPGTWCPQTNGEVWNIVEISRRRGLTLLH